MKYLYVYLNMRTVCWEILIALFPIELSSIFVYFKITLAYSDVCSPEVPEELYDTPVLGSPRVAVPSVTRSSPLHLQEDIGVGSLVEVATDVDQHYYGVVRWIGIIDGN